jgi:hypothetical protein
VNRVSKNVRSGGGQLYQIKITLKWSKPPIWRRVIVPANMTLDRFHQVIQCAMGWTNSHLHQFMGGTGFALTYYGTPNPDYADMGTEMLNEKRYSIADLAPVAKRKFVYEYDFGDGWQHEILVEKVLPPETSFKHLLCLGGANACPPEDCGGMGGYFNLLEILADPKHEEHQSMMDWIGGSWDATHFNADQVNVFLKRVKA